MPFAYFDRLSAAQKRTYRRSDGIVAVALRAPHRLPPLAAPIALGLQRADQPAVQAGCQQLVDELCRQLEVPLIRVKVHARRPSNSYGELHGLYTPDNLAPRAVIEVWMRTAKQQRVVALRTFLRTLLHEFCHHLDYELYKLSETFHTEGFYKRESSLMNQILPGEPALRTPAESA